MEADDLLCSRNARPEKALVGRAQLESFQPPCTISPLEQLSHRTNWSILLEFGILVIMVS